MTMETIHNFKDLVSYIDNYVNGGVYMTLEFRGDITTEYLVLNVRRDFDYYQYPFTIRKSTRGKICYFYDGMFYFNEHQLVNEMYIDLKKKGIFNKNRWRY